mmetsp:Transcript_13747/g.34517  ORF Transcript_13747/g.34517 Transcript_13747/m.34517 type:complete len:99 (+) Transcript_13747:1388-1684(+)
MRHRSSSKIDAAIVCLQWRNRPGGNGQVLGLQSCSRPAYSSPEASPAKAKPPSETSRGDRTYRTGHLALLSATLSSDSIFLTAPMRDDCLFSAQPGPK